MPGQEEKEILVQLAEVRQQMTAVTASVDEIKSSIKEILSLDRSIAELTVHQRQQAKDIQLQWERIDANRAAISAVDQKAEAWINKGRGAWSTLIILGGLAQAAVLGFIAYTFTHLRTAEDSLLLLNQRVVQIEQHQRKGGTP